VLTEGGVTHPVVRATIPTPATIKALAIALLAALGDPRAASGTVGSMTYRLTHYFRDCQVELLILDELQHFRDRDNRRVLENASNWLKTLIKETGVACVLVGLQGEAEEVVRLNPQLARLFGAPHVLLPFAWEERKPETVREFMAFLALVEGALPLAERPDLAGIGMARRLHAASGGGDGVPDGVAAGGDVSGADGGASNAGPGGAGAGVRAAAGQPAAGHGQSLPRRRRGAAGRGG